MLRQRAVALQGLDFPLSPIAAAVQGLIAELIEEARQAANVVGGRGGRKPLPGPQPDSLRRGADLTEEQVRAHWDLLEARQAKPREATADPAEASVPAASTAAPPAAPMVVPPAAAPEAVAPTHATGSALATGSASGAVDQAALDDDVAAYLLLLTAAATA